MTGKPGLNCLSGTIRQEIEWPPCFQVDEDRSIGVSPSQRKVINAQLSDLGRRSIFDRAQVAQQSWRFDLHSESGSQALTHLGRSRQSNGFELFQKAIAHSRIGLDQIRKTLSKHLPRTGGHAAKELAHLEPKYHSAASARDIMNRSLILTVDRV